MITFGEVRLQGHKVSNCIYFQDGDLQKMIYWLERSANTLSPPDPELLKILDDMKGVK